VEIKDVDGNLIDLIGAPLLDATETIKTGEASYGDTYAETTFALATSKARVVVKWYGQSNGYYSESVSFVETTKGEPNW
jgi:hypothetical protein